MDRWIDSQTWVFLYFFFTAPNICLVTIKMNKYKLKTKHATQGFEVTCEVCIVCG